MSEDLVKIITENKLFKREIIDNGIPENKKNDFITYAVTRLKEDEDLDITNPTEFYTAVTAFKLIDKYKGEHEIGNNEYKQKDEKEIMLTIHENQLKLQKSIDELLLHYKNKQKEANNQ